MVVRDGMKTGDKRSDVRVVCESAMDVVVSLRS
jgi:hypothetical protein